MNTTPRIQAKAAREAATTSGSFLAIALIAPLAGLGAGVIGALFRLTLAHADRLRDALIARSNGWGVPGFVLLMALAAAGAAIAAWLVRRFAPAASGSGVPRVVAVLHDEAPPAPAGVIPVKFLAGTLVIGSGLALGREGPTVQMGASIAYYAGRLFRRSWTDCRALIAAGAGAGLAVAFNAPISGAVFVLETLVKRFEVRIAIAALGASAISIWVGRALLGNAPGYALGSLVEPAFTAIPLFVLLGTGAGCAGVLYNRTLLASLSMVDRIAWIPIELRAASVGALVGAVAWFSPSLVGGGDVLAQQALSGSSTIGIIPLIFLLRLILIACSVAPGTPGGLLAPILALGAELGLFFGMLCALCLPRMGLQPEGFAVVGMAALFTAIVRAPLTGIVLVTEVTDNVKMLLPMIVACFAATLIPALLDDAPILDALRARLPATAPTAPPDNTPRV